MLETLPFFFRRNPRLGGVFLSNQAGAFAFLDRPNELECLVDGDYVPLANEKLAELTAKSFVAPTDEVSLRSALLASRLASQYAAALRPPGLFIIVPTLRCDHDCHYCQVSRAPLAQAGVDLPVSAIPRILDQIEALATGAVKVEFQGGEPLLAFPFIKAFVAAAEARFGAQSISYVICSALGPLDEEILVWLTEHEVVMSVSLDGQEAVHSRNRPSKYFESFHHTVDGIRRLRQHVGIERVAALSTVTCHTLAQPHELIQAYRDLGLSSMFLRPLTPLGFATHTQRRLGYSAEEFMAFYERILRDVIALNREGDPPFIEEMALVHLRRIFRPGDCTYVDLKSPCGYVFGAVVFNYDGNIFGSDEARMLWEMSGSPELVLGNVHAGLARFDAVATGNLISDTFICCTPGCEECAYQPFCGADPLHHLATQGDHIGDKSRSFFCALQQGMYDLLFDLFENDRAAREVFQRWLSL